MISFLGISNAGARLGSLGNADPTIRSDLISVAVKGTTTRLRYVNCPAAPFVDTSAQNVCDGK